MIMTLVSTNKLNINNIDLNTSLYYYISLLNAFFLLMDLVVEPDIYTPSTDELGNYVDKTPAFYLIKKGLTCPCCSRKDKLYDSASTFTAHTKTKTHQKWLSTINLNKANYYAENIKMQETIQNQRIIIAQLEKEAHAKMRTIDYLTQQLLEKKDAIPSNSSNKTVHDLIDFD